jgi:hypothetical protein
MNIRYFLFLSANSKYTGYNVWKEGSTWQCFHGPIPNNLPLEQL